MAIASLDNWWASDKQQVSHQFTGTRTTVAGIPFSMFGVAGKPGAGTLAGANTANGVVPDDTTAGFHLINAFTGSNGYLSNIDFTNTVAGRVILFDCVFKAGAYAFNANTTLASQPSYSGRMPGGTDFINTEIWLECVTAFTGNQSIAITYTNQSGTAARTTGTVATGVAPIVGRMFQMPLQAGDSGVQKIESVVSTVSTAGTFNVLVLRRLAQGRVTAQGLFKLDTGFTGNAEVFATSALFAVVVPDSTSSGTPGFFGTIANE